MTQARIDITQSPKTVVLVTAGERHDSLPAEGLRSADTDCVSLDTGAALALLRSRPFSVRAIVVSGDGESAATRALLEAVKEAAPRLPIVFLDERDSATSEVKVRRTGVHYYTHAPASTGEISAVLHGLAGGVSQLGEAAAQSVE